MTLTDDPEPAADRGRIPDLSDLVHPAELTVYVHAPSDAELDLAVLARPSEAERWSHAGQPTVYLARDPGVLAAEWARHLDPTDLASARPWRLRVRSERALDLTAPVARARLSLPADATWILDRERTRALATAIRSADAADALLVPSAGLLDRPDRGNLVVLVPSPAAFADRVVGEPRPIGTWQWATLAVDDDQAPSSSG